MLMSGCSDGGRGAPRDGAPLADGVEFEDAAAGAQGYWPSAPSVSKKLRERLMSAEKVSGQSGSQTSRAALCE